MDKLRIERTLSALSKQVPRAPSALVENMVRTANLLERKHGRHIGSKDAAVSHSADIEPPQPKKGRKKTL